MKTQPELSRELLVVDVAIISSLIQKSVRRGELIVAQRAAFTLLMRRGPAIWRRLLVVTFEDVGIGDPDLLIEAVSLTTDPSSRKRLGGNGAAAVRLAGLLANAPKDRSTDYLIRAARFHPRLESIRKALRRAPLNDCLGVVEDPEWPLPERALAAWYASGLPWEGVRGECGDLEALLDHFRRLGVPEALVGATATAARQIGEPITILVPLLWLASRAVGFSQAQQVPVPPTRVAAGVPLYALDKHTRLGRAAIATFAAENGTVRQFLDGHVEVGRRRDAVMIAAYHVDGTPIANRFDWPASHALDAFGRETDLLRAGVAPEAHERLCGLVRANLEHLNQIRVAVLLRSGAVEEGRARPG